MIWTDKNDEIEPNASGPEGAQINSSASAPEGAPHTSSERPAIRESEGEYPDYSPVNRSPDEISHNDNEEDKTSPVPASQSDIYARPGWNASHRYGTRL
jgi:hypothetical protein